MNRIYAFALMLLFVMSGCESSGSRNVNKGINVAGHDLEDPSPAENIGPDRQKYSTNIDGSEGVVVLSEDYGENDTVRIFDENGGIWYEFSYYDEAAFDELESINTDFRPFAFHPDYLLLAMRVVGQTGTSYEVVVNEETGLRKFVRKDDKSLEYETFEKHIVSTYAVDFDEKANPVLSEPYGEAETIDYSKIGLFRASEVEGDWVLVTWEVQAPPSGSNSNAAPDAQRRSGWVRWRNERKMIIDLYYFA